jgi:hypothetical protein
VIELYIITIFTIIINAGMYHNNSSTSHIMTGLEKFK